jgi:hypothetical protein
MWEIAWLFGKMCIQHKESKSHLSDMSQQPTTNKGSSDPRIFKPTTKRQLIPSSKIWLHNQYIKTLRKPWYGLTNQLGLSKPSQTSPRNIGNWDSDSLPIVIDTAASRTITPLLSDLINPQP